jgi:hypothetical protein
MNNYFTAAPCFLRLNRIGEERESALHSRVKIFLKNILSGAVSYLAQL